MIVSDLVYLNDAPKSEDGKPRREDGTLKMVRRVVGWILHTDNEEVMSTSSRGLARMMDTIVVV